MNLPSDRWSAIRIHPDDDVICLLRDHDIGEVPAVDDVSAPALKTAVPSGHKIALRAIAAGEVVLKYGHPIGRATRAIEAGDHVHLHNLQGLSKDRRT